VEVSARGAVRIVTTPADPGFTHLFSTAYGSGHGGAIRIGGDTVSLETASIESFTLGSGEAGPIELRGRAIDVVSGTFMAAYSAPGSTGRASGIDIAATERVRVAGADWSGFLSDVVTDTSTSHDAGAVRIAAPEIEVANGAVVRSLSEPFASGASGSITLAGAKRVALTDDALVQAASAGPRRGGDLRIEAGDLVVSAFSNVESASHGVGRAGDVVVRVAGEVVLDNGYLQSLALASGPAGRVDVEAGALTITNFGRVDSTTSNDGAGGDVSVRAGRVTVASAGAIAANSGRLFVGGQPIVGRGPGGRVTVEASEEITLTGAFSGISAGTLGAGDSGDVQVRTPRLTITDGAQIGANTGGAGHAGGVTLEVGDLEVRNRGGITSGNGLLSGARGTGDAGEIRIRASGSMLVTGGGIIESSTFTSGRGGQITIDAGELTVRDGGLINTGTEGTGAAGTVTVRAGVIRIADHTSGIFATTFGPGPGGRVQVTTPRLVITDDGEIGANTGGSGHAGSVIVDVGELELRRGFTGNSGEIQVRVAGNALLADQSLIATNTFSSGNGGRITLEARDIVVTGGSGIGAATVAAGDGGAITIRGDALRMSDASRVVAGTFAIGDPGSGDGNAGSVTVDVGRLELAGGSRRAAARPATSTSSGANPCGCPGKASTGRAACSPRPSARGGADASA
jgi:large exoprotein involved in heme utilization and adhesion